MGTKINAADTPNRVGFQLGRRTRLSAGLLSGILFLVIEKDSQFVRFHALQSTMVFLTIFVATVLTSTLWAIPLIGWLISTLLNMLLVSLTLILWLFLMFKAYSGERFKLPILGDLAEQQS